MSVTEMCCCHQKPKPNEDKKFPMRARDTEVLICLHFLLSTLLLPQVKLTLGLAVHRRVQEGYSTGLAGTPPGEWKSNNYV